MKLLLHYIHYPVSSGRYMTDAFRRLGHEVYHVGDPTGRNIWGIQIPEEYAWHQELPPNGWQPDLAILMDTAYQWYHKSVPTVIYTVDNHVRNVRQPGIQHYFLAHKSVSVTKWGNDCTWLPVGYDNVAFPPSPIEWSKREYDVCCLGFMYPKRWLLVEAMKAAGLKVVAGCGMVYDQYRDLHHNSRVALVSSFNGDLPIRLFEGAGMGCAIAYDTGIGDLALLDFEGYECARYAWAHYSTEIEAVEAVQELIKPIHAGEVKVGVEWASNHTWDARAQVIIDWVEGQR